MLVPLALEAALLISFLSLPLTTTSAACPTYPDIQRDLGSRLSKGSNISTSTDAAPRWSLYAAPNPKYVVTVASENDVAKTIKYANYNALQLLVQSQGNGWASTFHLGPCGILINIATLNTIAINPSSTLATIGGGTLVQDIVSTAYAYNGRVANPTCGCLGFLGASLGGGLTRLMGLYGAGIDQIVSANIVTATGETITNVSANSHPDLWFALRGAAANFGVVTSATIKVYPVPKAQNVAWTGALTFKDSQLEAVIAAIRDLPLTPQMEIDFLLATSGPPTYTPTISVIPIYFGASEAEAKQAFAPLLRLGPINDTTSILPYDQWSAFAESFCQKGLRKPTYGATVTTRALDPPTWSKVYADFKAFVKAHPEAGNSSVLAEYYPVQKAIQLEKVDGGAYPYRDVPIHIVAIPLYADKDLDKEANQFGKGVRKLLREADGGRRGTYINFAHGDETPAQIYGSSLSRLQQLKTKYDPKDRFNQWFDLSKAAGKKESAGAEGLGAGDAEEDSGYDKE